MNFRFSIGSTSKLPHAEEYSSSVTDVKKKKKIKYSPFYSSMMVGKIQILTETFSPNSLDR